MSQLFNASNRVIVIVGPTAVGKTDLSLAIASRFDAEIINADSMQLYRCMDIGTAKVPLDQRNGITHHMLDVLDVTESANVAHYQRQARSVVSDVLARGKRVVVVGGSGLFVQGLLDDLQFPGSDPDIRERLINEAQQHGTELLYARLKTFDPQAAASILPTNQRRIIRALEVIEITGQSPTTTLAQLPEIVPSIRIGVRRDRSELDVRIEQRVDAMWKSGFIDEVRALEAQGLREGLTASKALGYAQILELLAGDITEGDAKTNTVTATRRYVRRQESWFNRDGRIEWFASSGESASSLDAEVADYIHSIDSA